MIFRFCRLMVMSLTLILPISPLFLLPTVKAQEEDQPSLDREAKRAKEQREAEFQKLKDAADRLKQLSAELKEMIDQSTPHTFSIPIMKKTGEIEKALKEIKSRTRP